MTAEIVLQIFRFGFLLLLWLFAFGGLAAYMEFIETSTSGTPSSF